MNVHPHLHEAHFPFHTADACTRRMHVHLAVLPANVHPVLHLHGISGTI